MIYHQLLVYHFVINSRHKYPKNTSHFVLFWQLLHIFSSNLIYCIKVTFLFISIIYLVFFIGLVNQYQDFEFIHLIFHRICIIIIIFTLLSPEWSEICRNKMEYKVVNIALWFIYRTHTTHAHIYSTFLSVS